MAVIGPLTITARNRDQAEYLVRSRAEQRGVDVRQVDVSAAGGSAWLVTVVVADAEVAGAEAAHLDEDTQVPWASGVPPDVLAASVGQLGTDVRFEDLTDPALWGHAVTDERYAVVARR